MINLDREAIAQMKALAHLNITVTLPALDTFMAISAIQLATRHPDFPPSILPNVVGLANQLIDAIAPDPESAVHRALQMGWDPTHDYIKPRPSNGGPH